MRIIVVSSFLVLCLAPNTTYAQSFNCRFARTADEVLICQHDRLSALDEQMANTYYQLRTRLYGMERRILQTEQADWLRMRRDCGRDKVCIEESYRQRIRELETYYTVSETVAYDC